MTPQLRKLRIGFVGAGYVNQIGHLANYAQIPECEIVALAEPREGLRRAVAEKYSIPQTFFSHKELLANAEVDAIVAVTPREITGPVALDVLRAGRHLMTEKPMACSVSQAEALVSAARENRCIHSVAYMRRHDEGVTWAKNAFDDLRKSNELGPVTSAAINVYQGDFAYRADGDLKTNEPIVEASEKWNFAPDWLDENNQHRFAFYVNRFSHNLNLLRYFFGETPEVEYFKFRNFKSQTAVFDFDGIGAVMNSGDFSYHAYEDRFDIYFERGRIQISCPAPLFRNSPAKVELYKSAGESGMAPESAAPQLSWSWSFKRQAEAFVRDCLEGRTPIANGEDALEDLKLAEAMWRKGPASTK